MAKIKGWSRFRNKKDSWFNDDDTDIRVKVIIDDWKDKFSVHVFDNSKCFGTIRLSPNKETWREAYDWAIKWMMNHPYRS